jgi:Phytochelatin synthase
LARSIGLISMKRRRYIILSIVSVVVVFVLLGAGAFVVGQTYVSPQAIASSVTRTPELMERAWHLPVAATFNRQVNWQSNGSRCGPAAVANAYRSLGESTSTEGKVLAGTGRCWTGFCILGLTLDELADVARANTNRKITLLRDLTEEQFRAHLRHSNDPGRRYIVNFSRERILGPASDIIHRSAATSKQRISCSCSTSIRTTDRGWSRVSACSTP